MKKILLAIAITLVSASSFAATTYCPCPGACCPTIKDVNSLIHMADYLSPYATDAKTQNLIEKDLAAHRVIS